LYVYSQILMALSLTEAKYATTNTKEEFWAVWKEKDEEYQNTIQELVNRPLASEWVDKLFAHPDIRIVAERKRFEDKYALPVAAHVQDIHISGLAEPERLLQIVKEFILFEGGVVKKVARFQQFLAINKTMQRIKPIRNGKRKGGVLSHTQGSGKSLT